MSSGKPAQGKKQIKGETLKIRDDGTIPVTSQTIRKMRFIPPMTIPAGMSMAVVFRGSIPEFGMVDSATRVTPVADMGRLAQLNRVLTEDQDKKTQADPETFIKVQAICSCIGITVPNAKIDPGNRAEIIRIAKQYLAMEENLAQLLLAEVADEVSAQVRETLIDQCHRGKRVARAMIVEVLTPHRKRSQTSELCSIESVSTYIWEIITTILTRAQLTSPLYQLFYPTKLDNAIYLTTAELRNPVLSGRMTYFLSRCTYLRDWANHPDFNDLFVVKRQDTIGAAADIAEAESFAWRLIPVIPRADVMEGHKYSHKNRSKATEICLMLNEALIDYYLGIAGLGHSPVEFLEHSISDFEAGVKDVRRNAIDFLREDPTRDRIPIDVIGLRRYFATYALHSQVLMARTCEEVFPPDAIFEDLDDESKIDLVQGLSDDGTTIVNDDQNQWLIRQEFLSAMKPEKTVKSRVQNPRIHSNALLQLVAEMQNPYHVLHNRRVRIVDILFAVEDRSYLNELLERVQTQILFLQSNVQNQ